MKTELFKVFQCQSCYSMAIYYLHYKPEQALFVKWWWVCDVCGAKSKPTMARAEIFWKWFDIEKKKRGIV